MEGFFDSGKFRFEELSTSGGHTYMTPVHHRDLGEKEDELYSPSVSWSDVARNGIPLEQTFQYQDDILKLENERDDSLPETDTIMVNSRPSQPLILEEEIEDKRWVKRLEKLYPMNYQEAKNKRKSVERYPVKPKSKKQVRDEKIYSSADKFNEITDEKKGGEKSLDYTIYIQKKGDHEIIKDLDYMNRPSVYKRPIRTKYCPPLHWLEPTVQWEEIWRHVDELKTGKKRDYHYYPNGIANCENEPCIYFYDKDSDDLNYNFNWEKDFMNVVIYFNY
jgi:hypothetical protein